MTFGQNPYVRRAELAESKAADATDEATRTRAYRDAAHEWERAATRERAGQVRDEYERKAEANRRLANGEDPELESNGAVVQENATPVDPKDLN
jgi:hypothetical protein